MSIQLVSKKINTTTSSTNSSYILGESVVLSELDIPVQDSSLVFLDVLAMWYKPNTSYAGAMKRSFVALYSATSPTKFNLDSIKANNIEIITAGSGTPNLGFVTKGGYGTPKTFWGGIGELDESNIENGITGLNFATLDDEISVVFLPNNATNLSWEIITDIYMYERL